MPVAAIWLIVILSGCNSSLDSVDKYAVIFFAQNNLLLNEVGAQLQLSPLAIDANGEMDTDPSEISWSSSNTTIVSISTSGVMTAEGNGAAVVTASNGSVMAKITIIVQDPDVTAATNTAVVALIIAPSTPLLTTIGETLSLSGYLVLENGSILYNSAGITWESLNPAILSIDSTGEVTALADGVAQIRATTDELSTTVTVLVNSDQTAIPQEVVVVVVENDLLYSSDIGATEQLGFSAFDQSLTEITSPQSVSWLSEDSSIATVDSSGVVTFVGDGATNIVLMVDGVSIMIPVIVDTTLRVISGKVQYEDMLYDINGFTGSKPPKPIREASIDLVGSITASIVSTTVSDQDGIFQFYDVPNGDYYLRITASNGSDTPNSIAVKDLSGLIYSVTKNIVFDGSEVGINIIVTEESIGGAFNIYDTMLAAEDVVHILSTNLLEFEPLSLYWSDTNFTYGTYTCNINEPTWCHQGVGIYVLGGDRVRGNDTDDYDDDVLWHEFTHFLEYNLGIDDSPGGFHTPTDNDLDLRLAWSEGFSNYWSLFLRSYLKSGNIDLKSGSSQVPSHAPTLPSSTYVDTAGYRAYFTFDIDQSLNASQIYATNEVATSKLLFELEKIPGAGVTPIFDTLWSLMPAATGQANLEQFWDGWLTGVDVTQAELGQAAAIERKINYFEDQFETDNGNLYVVVADCLSASTCYEQEHTLYLDSGVLDNDVVVLNVSKNLQYTVETLYLKNGADTILQVLDGSGAQYPIESGYLDDAYPLPCDSSGCNNTSTGLASRVVIQPAIDGIMEIDVRTPVDPYLFSGQYGTYTLRVTAQ